MNKKYTREILEPLVKDSKSISQVVRKLNLRLSGGSSAYIRLLVNRFDINTDHFTGQGWNIGRTGFHRRNASEVLVVRKIQTKEKAIVLRRCLIEIGRPYKCEVCDGEPIWNGKPIVLEVDHINNNWLDNRKENLRFICPNCHSQTVGYSGRGKKV